MTAPDRLAANRSVTTYRDWVADKRTRSRA